MKRFFKENIKFIIVILICVVGSGLSTYATEYLFNSSDVYYDNSTSGIQAGNVQSAIDELYSTATDYSEIKSIIGNDSLTTNSQTLTGAVNEINDNLKWKLVGTSNGSAINLPDVPINEILVYINSSNYNVTFTDTINYEYIINEKRFHHGYYNGNGGYGWIVIRASQTYVKLDGWATDYNAGTITLTVYYR